MSPLREQLEAAERRLAALRERQESYSRKSAGATPGGLSDYDPAVLSGIRRKPDHKADQRRWNAYSREAEGWREVEAQERQVKALQHRVAEAERPRLTREDVLAATHIKTDYGWHKVARVNKTTVSVETGYSWVDRYAFDKVLEARTVAA